MARSSVMGAKTRLKSSGDCTSRGWSVTPSGIGTAAVVLVVRTTHGSSLTDSGESRFHLGEDHLSSIADQHCSTPNDWSVCGMSTSSRDIKEGKAATHRTRLSCHRFRANGVRPARRHRPQPWQSAAPARPAARHLDPVPNRFEAAAVQAPRAPHSARPVLRPPTGREPPARELLDSDALSTDPRAQRAGRRT